MTEALEIALSQARISMNKLDGLLALPSLSHPHFMEAHHVATRIGILPHPGFLVRTIDTGGASPVTGLLEAVRMIKSQHCEAVAIVAGDSVASMKR